MPLRRSLQPMPDPKNMTDRRDLFTQTEAELGHAVLLSTDRRVRSSGSSGGYGGGSGGGGGGGGGGSGGSGGGSSF